MSTYRLVKLSSLLLLLALSACPEPTSQPASKPETTNARSTPPKDNSIPRECLVKSLDGVQILPLLDVFPKDEARSKNFQDEFVANPAQAVKEWIKTSSVLSSLKDIDSVEAKLLSEQGVGHDGIFEVSIPHHERKYFLKVSTHDNEADHLFKLQKTIASHPSCYSRLDLGLHSVATKEQVERFPRFAQLLDAAQFPYTKKRTSYYGDTSKTHLYFLLMEKANGVALADLGDSIPKMKHNEEAKLADSARANEAYRAVGYSLGLLHYFSAQNASEPLDKWLTFAHGDLHANNVFFDKRSGQVTFIDNDNMNSNKHVDYDISQLASFSFTMRYSGSSLLEKLLVTLQEEEAARKGLVLGSSYAKNPNALKPYEATLGALENPQVQLDLRRTFAFQMVKQAVARFNAVASGYIEALPKEKTEDARHYFSEICKYTAKAFIEYALAIADANDKMSDRRFLSAIKHIFPDNLNACREKGVFE